ncbi:MAG: hypothetical protein QJR08_03625, partial [Bacillota bacterium]|nr:hypothetical protein [Bacillota bacterium]
AAVLLVLLLLAALPSGYVLLEPGPAPEASALVRVRAAGAATAGAPPAPAAGAGGTACGGPRIRLLTVRLRSLRIGQLPEAWLRAGAGEAQLLPADSLLGGLSLAGYAARARRQMAEAEAVAVRVATAAYPGSGPAERAGPGAGRWRWRAPGGRELEIRVADDGIAGPSAGLGLALELERQIGCQLAVAGARRPLPAPAVAVSGTLDGRGRVGPVGGVGLKAIAARRAGASLLLLPAGEADQAKEAFGTDRRVVGVRDFREAVRALGLPPVAAAPGGAAGVRQEADLPGSP